VPIKKRFCRFIGYIQESHILWGKDLFSYNNQIFVHFEVEFLKMLLLAQVAIY